MICSTSLKLYSAKAELLALILITAFFVADLSFAGGRSGELPAIDSQLVTHLHLKTNARPRWARFSPSNPRLILLDIDGQGAVATLPSGTIRHIPERMLPVGWLGQIVVARDQSGIFRLLNEKDFAPAENMTLGVVTLPWTLGKNKSLSLDLSVPATKGTSFISAITGAEFKDSTFVAREIASSLNMISGSSGREILDEKGNIVFRGSKKIFGITPSPDTYKLVVYYGNTDYVLFNRLTGCTINLPVSIEAWTWLPDNSTLLGQMNTIVDNRIEEVAKTELYVFESVNERLTPIKLASSHNEVALRILDVSPVGQILLEAERVVSEPAYLGLMVYELIWPKAPVKQGQKH